MRYLLLLLSFIIIFHAAAGQSGKVIAISDGDTFTIMLDSSRKEKIRLYGIDCPENNQPFSKKAKQFLSQLIFGKTVRILVKNTDRYGRKVAIVYTAANTNVNEALLKAGLAWHYKEFDKNAAWDRLEKQARQAKKGLWSASETPVAPWRWRKNIRSATTLTSTFYIVPDGNGPARRPVAAGLILFSGANVIQQSGEHADTRKINY